MRRPARPQVPMADCQLCSEPIVFVHLDTGSTMPLNPLPSLAGKVACSVVGRKLEGYVVSKRHRPDPYAWLMTPHAATCEELKAEQLRRRPEPHPALF